MYVFVVTGRAGEHLWPAKVFAEHDEMPAKIYVDITGGIANACRTNLKAFRESDLWAKMTIKERFECEQTIRAPIDAMDVHALEDPELEHVISYTLTRVALHD